MVEVFEIVVHKADQPNLLADLFDADALAGEDEAEIDLPPIEADAATRGHGGGLIVERIKQRVHMSMYLVDMQPSAKIG